MNLVFLGPPGSGKGTASAFLSDKLGVPRFVASELLRAEIKTGSVLGLTIATYMETGDLVPDDLVIKVVLKNLENVKGFILDGFPRTEKQAIALKEALAKLSMKLDKVVYLDVSFETAKERNLARMICKSCGFSPQPTERVCPRCGGVLVKRLDDNEETIKRRFENYIKETQPLVDFYKDENILVRIDASSPAEIMNKQILTELGYR